MFGLMCKSSSCLYPSVEPYRCRTRAMNRTLPVMRPVQFPRSIAAISHTVTVKGKIRTTLVKPHVMFGNNSSVKVEPELISPSTIGHKKPETLCVASISTSGSKITTSKGMPQILPPHYLGSRFLWMGFGLGVGISVIFQVRYALLRIFERMTNQAAAESVQFNGSAFSLSAEFTLAESTSSPATVQISSEPDSSIDAQNLEAGSTLMPEASTGIEMQKPRKEHGSLDVYHDELLQAGGSYRKEPISVSLNRVLKQDQEAIENFQVPKVDSGVIFLNSKPWTVPWTAETIIQVMLLWIASFWFVGSWIIPFLAHAAGFSKESLTHRGQALYSLLTDVAEGLAGIAILHRCLAKFCPLPADWFRFSLKGNWHFDVGLGCLLFPLVNFLSRININMVPTLPAPPVGVSSVEQSIVARDPVAMALYALVVSICAPIWEEILFRGFLLPSLTRYMPLWCSIMLSAVAFALAHFNAQRLLPLVFLGVVMGAVFAKSKNLMASMLLHSLWNGFVFLDLMK